MTFRQMAKQVYIEGGESSGEGPEHAAQHAARAARDREEMMLGERATQIVSHWVGMQVGYGDPPRWGIQPIDMTLDGGMAEVIVRVDDIPITVSMDLSEDYAYTLSYQRYPIKTLAQLGRLLVIEGEEDADAAQA